MATKRSLDNQQLLGELSGKMDLILIRQESLGEAIFGNGEPEKGMFSKIDRIASSVEIHHKSIHLATLLKSLKFWGYGLLTLVFINLACDFLHPVVVALIKAWTGVEIP